MSPIFQNHEYAARLSTLVVLLQIVKDVSDQLVVFKVLDKLKYNGFLSFTNFLLQTSLLLAETNSGSHSFAIFLSDHKLIALFIVMSSDQCRVISAPSWVELICAKVVVLGFGPRSFLPRPYVDYHSVSHLDVLYCTVYQNLKLNQMQEVQKINVKIQIVNHKIPI